MTFCSTFPASGTALWCALFSPDSARHKTHCELDLTCTNKHDGIILSIQCHNTIHHNSGQQGSLSDQQWPTSHWLNSFVHELMVPDELKGFVGKVLRASYSHGPYLIVDALRRRRKKESDQNVLFIITLKNATIIYGL